MNTASKYSNTREWLKNIRINQNESQQNIADKANITAAYYSMIETNLRRPSIKVAKEIGKALNFKWTKFFE